MLKENINHAVDIYRQKRYSIESENCIKVDSHYVMKKTRNNKTLFTCDCENSEKTDNVGFCRHKLFFIYYPFLEKLYKDLNENINIYNMKSKYSCSTREEENLCLSFVDVLKDLKSIKC